MLQQQYAVQEALRNPPLKGEKELFLFFLLCFSLYGSSKLQGQVEFQEDVIQCCALYPQWPHTFQDTQKILLAFSLPSFSFSSRTPHRRAESDWQLFGGPEFWILAQNWKNGTEIVLFKTEKDRKWGKLEFFYFFLLLTEVYCLYPSFVRSSSLQLSRDEIEALNSSLQLRA